MSGWIKVGRDVRREIMALSRVNNHEYMSVYLALCDGAQYRPSDVTVEGTSVRLAVGEQLVSVRGCSRAAGVKRQTVERAWLLFENRGWIRRRAAISRRETGQVAGQVAGQPPSIVTVAELTISADEAADAGTAHETRRGSSRDDTRRRRISSPKEKCKKLLFTPESEPMVTALFLRDCVLRWKPDLTEPDTQAWASEFDRIFRLDKRDPTHVRDVIDFVSADEKLQRYLLAPRALRCTFPDGTPKFDAFTAAMAKRGRSGRTSLAARPPLISERRELFSGEATR